ncbi:hypothetical protein MAHJHV57_51000 [Mycobacterium avium subsp. hominissuis]
MLRCWAFAVAVLDELRFTHRGRRGYLCRRGFAVPLRSIDRGGGGPFGDRRPAIDVEFLDVLPQMCHRR